jgi:hypothetical protein
VALERLTTSDCSRSLSEAVLRNGVRLAALPYSRRPARTCANSAWPRERRSHRPLNSAAVVLAKDATAKMTSTVADGLDVNVAPERPPQGGAEWEQRAALNCAQRRCTAPN